MAMTFKFQDNSDFVLNRVNANAMKAMELCGDEMVRNVRDMMLEGYDEPHPHPYPHTSIQVTRALHDSIKAEAQREGADIVSVAVGTNMPYAKYVHDGTYKLHGRPFIKDGVERSQGIVESIIDSVIREGL